MSEEITIIGKCLLAALEAGMDGGLPGDLHIRDAWLSEQVVVTQPLSQVGALWRPEVLPV